MGKIAEGNFKKYKLIKQSRLHQTIPRNLGHKISERSHLTPIQNAPPTRAFRITAFVQLK